jgi:hypothetical protein
MRDVFEEVKLEFLVVAHTHEDIDGCFEYFSKKLREQNNYVLADLMKAFHGLPRAIIYSLVD